MDKKKGRAPIACLYAAPGFFPRDREKNKKNDPPDIAEVYAAPEFFGNGENGGEEPEAPIAPVYAAPDVLEGVRVNGEGKDYPASFEEEPDIPPKPDPQIMMCVYAGPDYFAGRTDIHGNPLPKKDGAPEAPEEPIAPEGSEEPALAGRPPIPDVREFTDMPLMGLVSYDPGKDSVIGSIGMMKMNAPAEKKPFVERENGKQPNFCRECGGRLGKDMKFCPNCGAKVFKC